MTRESADSLWGPEAVEHALADEHPDAITRALAQEIRDRAAMPPGAFRAWALAQSWPRFCAIVRVVSGVAREELLAGGDDEKEGDDGR